MLEGSCPGGDGIDDTEATEATFTMLARAAQLAHLDGSRRIRLRHILVALVHEPTVAPWAGLSAVGLRPERVAAYMGGNVRSLLEQSFGELARGSPAAANPMNGRGWASDARVGFIEPTPQEILGAHSETLLSKLCSWLILHSPTDQSGPSDDAERKKS